MLEKKLGIVKAAVITGLMMTLLPLNTFADYITKGKDGPKIPNTYFSTRPEMAKKVKEASEHRRHVGYFPQNMSTFKAKELARNPDKHKFQLYKDLKTTTKGIFTPEYREKIEKEFGTKDYSVLEINFKSGAITVYGPKGLTGSIFE